MAEYQFITSLGFLGQYAAIIPRIADDELDPHEYRLYGHYVQICGSGDEAGCWESTRTTAEKTRMSAGMVVQVRARLAKGNWVIVTEHPVYRTRLVQIVDRWQETMARYARRSPGERIVVDPSFTDQFVLDEIKQQQLSFLRVHDVNTLDPRLGYLISECNLTEDIPPQALMEWTARYGIDRVHEAARWYCYMRDRKLARTGGWLRKALEEGWGAPEGFQGDMYLSKEQRLERFTSGGWDEIER